MKKFILAAVVLLTTIGTYAQMPAGARPGGGNIPAIGRLYGKLTDADGKAVSDASVLVLQGKMDTVTKKMKEVLLKGGTSANNGEFSIEGLPIMGQLTLKISATGYAALDQKVSIMSRPAAGQTGPPQGGMPSTEKDLGTIKLKTDVTQLQSVSVTATKPLMKFDGEKKVFNVDKNIVSAGGTAVDVMKNVPSVNVDIDGNVSLRNSAPQVFVDGRPTTLTLEQIPADAIESVEVITNPSAKYDASGGGAGILNIVLKKNRKSGYNGNIRAGVDKRGGVNAGGDFNIRKNKLNFTASGMINQNRGRTTGETDRTNLLDSPQTHVLQNIFTKQNGGFAFGRLGVDYFATNRTTFSISGVRVHGKFDSDDLLTINTDSLYNTGKISSLSSRTTTGKREFNAYGLVGGFKHIFPKEGEELTTDLNYFSGKFKNNTLYNTTYQNAFRQADLQRILGDGDNNTFTIQSDYVKPLAAKTKIELGARAQLRSISSNLYNYNFDYNANDYVLNASPSDNYKNTDNVYAAYATFSSAIKDFSYKLGLRAESSEYSGELIKTKQTFGNKYPISLFPSVFLSQKVSDKDELQLSYSRRINRPNFFQLIPFTDSSDRLNITQGNPALVPEFTQSFELNYLKTMKKNNTIMGSLYYKRTTDLITRYLTKDPNSSLLINTYINANSSYSAGAELTTQTYATKWMDFSTNVNVYNSKVNTDNINGSSQDALWSWFGKFNSNFKLPAKFSTQLSATYQSKTNLPVNKGGGGFGGPGGFGQAQSASQGYIKSFYGVDIAIKKSFLKNDAAALTLNVSDIFRTRRTTQFSQSDYFVQTYDRIRDPQMFRLNFSYRFGKIDMSLSKRKTNSNMSGATEGMQQ